MPTPQLNANSRITHKSGAILPRIHCNMMTIYPVIVTCHA